MCPLLSQANLRGAKILLVDDDPLLSQLLVDLLRALGCHPQPAATLAVAREMVRCSTTGFDAALLDLRLPDGSGATLVPMLHASALPCAVLVLTGMPPAIATGIALAADAHDLLCKPVRPADLAQKLSRAIDCTQRLRGGENPANWYSRGFLTTLETSPVSKRGPQQQRSARTGIGRPSPCTADPSTSRTASLSRRADPPSNEAVRFMLVAGNSSTVSALRPRKHVFCRPSWHATKTLKLRN
ncbi:MAG: response regulator [Nannocystaceae bacterium]